MKIGREINAYQMTFFAIVKTHPSRDTIPVYYTSIMKHRKNHTCVESPVSGGRFSDVDVDLL